MSTETRTRTDKVVRLDHWISGAPLEPTNGTYLPRHCPRSGDLVTEVADGNAADIDAGVSAAAGALQRWQLTSPQRRSEILHTVAHAIDSRAEEFAALEALETGRSDIEVRSNITTSARYFRFYAGAVVNYSGLSIDLGPGQHAYTRREPYGVTAIITPWNAPMNQAARAIAPALAVGNTCVVKPSEFTSASTLLLAQTAEEAGLPPGILNVVTGTGERAGAALTADPRVEKVAFTGSLRTGAAIAATAASRMVSCTMELGGKSANIVFADADLDQAVDGALQAFTYNAGQICIAGSRLLIEESIYQTFVDRLARNCDEQALGTNIGPIITPNQYERVHEYFKIAESEGAQLRAGGPAILDNSLADGQFIAPTIYTGVTNDMRIAREEIFGPVVVAIPFKDETSAVEIANDSDFGLYAAVWTRDLSRAHRLAASINSGQVVVNQYLTDHIETPFGGYKRSGIGREKGIEALDNYTQSKSVIIKL